MRPKTLILLAAPLLTKITDPGIEIGYGKTCSLI